MRNRRQRFTPGEKREIGEEFVKYLTARNLIRTWHRPELAVHYQEFAQERRSLGRPITAFSAALFALSRYGRAELQVRGGQTIVFRGTDDFSNRSIKTAPKIQSHLVEITVVSENTSEWRPGRILRKLSDISAYEFSFIEVDIKNVTGLDVTIARCELKTRSKDFQLNSEIGTVIPPSSSSRISIQSLEQFEVCTTEVEITLSGRSTTEKLLRYIKFEVVSEEDLLVDNESDDEESPKTSSRDYVSFANFVPGEKPDTMYSNKLEMKWPLPENRIPSEVENAIHRRIFDPKAELDKSSDIALRDAMKQPLDGRKYKSKFSLLLHIEEWRNRQDIKRYDIPEATLTQRRGQGLLYLKVPGLAEKRPSVLRGDRVYVRPLTSGGDLENESYQGYVHHVEEQEVGLGFNQSIFTKHIKNKKYYVRFDFNRLALKLMHRAVGAMPSRGDFQDILFPITVPREETGKPLKMLNRLIEDNDQQRQAVENIVAGNPSKVFIIYGPPGTGKTITMVETIHQTIRINSSTHMLVCAPSNSACDLLTQRLLAHVDKREILRMHAASRNWAEVPAEVKDVSNHEGEFCYPRKEELIKCRIIVTTLITAGRIASAQFPKDHFDYVFIDEAGQAMEPEAMIAVAGILSDRGKVVLAGDPKQLGPIIRSSIANRNGLEKSFLERLMTTSPTYQKGQGTYNSQCVVKLLNNYRSHESIIHVSNEQFYDNELQVCANDAQRNYLCDWEKLPKRNFPIIFHGMQGEDKRESTSPSFFNPQEAKQVKQYVDHLLDIRGGGKKVRARDIGVITPYRKQVQKIRKELGNTDIKVGSVEEFQGQERRVIIISTVRSNTQHLQFDARFNLGFLRNPKRFNVAVTRAKSLMIIIGNPYILWFDPYWRSLLKYCIDKGGYTGIKFVREKVEAEVMSLESKLLELTLSPHTNGETTDDHINPQWRQDP